MQHAIQVFNYKGNDVAFDLQSKNVMVNATEMAKAFGKNPAHFLENKATREYIKLLDRKLGVPCLRINRGARNSGTWMSRQLAIKFAAWLNPEFELWVYEMIERLIFGDLKDLQKVIVSRAKIRSDIKRISNKLMNESEDYRDLVKLQTEDRQIAYQISRINTRQTELALN